MKYAWKIERQDGTSATGTITAANIAQAHATMTAGTAAGDKYRVFPLCRALLALSIATATAKNAVMRQGTETQIRIDRECRMLSGMTAAAMAARPEMSNRDVTSYIMERLPLFSQDAQEFFSCAMDGIERATAAGRGIATATAAGYKVLNSYIYSLKTATDKELSTEYLIDGGGDIVALTTVVSCIIRGGDKWTATNGGGMTAAQAENLGQAIREAAATLRPVQREIIALLGRGYSQRQIAAKTGRELATVNRNIAIIRGIMSEYIAANYPEFVDMTTESTIDATAAQAAAHKAESINKGQATQAARAAAYRARKRAAAQAAAMLK